MGHTASLGGKIDEKKLFSPKTKLGGNWSERKYFEKKKKKKNEALFPIGKDGWGLVDKIYIYIL